MASVASKNLFEILGNDPDEDGETRLPVIPVEKPAQRYGKRNASSEAPSPAAAAPVASAGRGGRGGRGGRRGNMTGNEQAFHDREAGRANNRDKPIEDGPRRDRNANQSEGGRGQRSGRYEGRGGRGGAGGRGARGGDRHSRTGIADHPKQAEKGWGENTGNGEWNDEKAGEQIAREEEKTGFDSTVDKPVNAEGENPTAEDAAAEPEPEPEDKTKSYAAFLAEQTEKKLALSDKSLTVRKANEGSKIKLPEGKAIEREDEAAYMVGTGGKQARQREKKDKNFIALDHDMIARENQAARGGSIRGGSRGGRGRGGPRGGRGEFRGGRGRGGAGSAPAISDSSAFPSLGA